MTASDSEQRDLPPVSSDDPRWVELCRLESMENEDDETITIFDAGEGESDPSTTRWLTIDAEYVFDREEMV